MRILDLEGLGSRMDTGAPSRNRTGTPAIHEAADFKSAVSTNFTIGAFATQSQLGTPLV